MFQIRNLNKIYYSKHNKVQALKNINIDFGENGLIFVVGKTGSGKSTLLNLLGGLDSITSGEVIIDGFSTSQFKQSDFDAFRNFFIGFVFQDFNLIDEVNVFENISTILKLKKEKYDFSTIEDALKMVGLEGLGYRKPSELSGGQRQRIAIARALVKNPKIILADEPTGALDNQTGRDLISSLKSLAEEKLVIVVTHDKNFAIEFGDRILELKEGEIISDRILKNNDKSIIELKQGLFKLSSNVFLNSDSVNKLNEKFMDNKENYLCINTQIDKVALGYTENFDDLYNQMVSEDSFEKSDKELQEIKYQKGHFPKVGIRIKELFNMAYHNIMRKKIRFIFSTLFVSIAFVFISVFVALSTFSISTISATTIKDYGLPLANLRYGESDKFSNFPQAVLDDLDAINLKYTKNYDLSISYYGLEYSNFYINGITEVKDFTQYDFNLLVGRYPDKPNEILITDLVADTLFTMGYIGLDEDGHYRGFRATKLEDIIGISIDLNRSSSVLVNITGIINTDYNKYYKKHDDSNYATTYFHQIYTIEGGIQYYRNLLFPGEGQPVTSIFIDGKMNKANLAALLNKLKKKSIYLNISLYSSSTNELYNMQLIVSNINNVAIKAGVLFAALGFLLILNFVFGSIRARKKEIGILRANGAKASNIFSIFIIETMIMGLLVWFFSGLLTSVLIKLSNGGYLFFADFSALSNISVINYTLLNFLLSGFILSLFILIATILPVFNIVFQKPANAIKRD